MRRTWLPIVAAVLCLIAEPLYAHEEHRSNLDVVLDRVSPQSARLEVRIVDTLAPQMLVTNRTGQTLEILDARGIPVIRIGAETDGICPPWPSDFSRNSRYSPGTTTAGFDGIASVI